MADRDPLDDLAALWQRATPPALDADGEEPADERTAASLAWMRAAWDALEAPEPVVPRPATRAWPLPLAALAAAAALLLLALPRPEEGAQPVAGARVSSSAGTEAGPAVSPASGPAGEAEDEAPLLVDEQPIPSLESQALAAPYVPNALELRRGRVRLVLLEAPEEDGPVPVEREGESPFEPADPEPLQQETER